MATITTRRLFLSSALHPLAMSLVFASPRQPADSARQLRKEDLAQFRNELLELVNAERMSQGVSSLAIDDLACTVAEQHALDMAAGRFLSHWGRDGRKAYHRYCDAGGTDAVEENVSAADDLESPTSRYVALTLTQMHIKMYQEVPPNDGHKRTILATQHTHAGFGAALIDRELRLVELYVARYVHLEPYQRQAKRKATVEIKGKLLDPSGKLRYAELFFEPIPAAPEIEWLRVGRPYGLPRDYKTIRLIPPEGMLYADGKRGEIEVGARGGFRIPVQLYKNEPGIYTLVVWINDGGRNFPATNACIKAV